MDTQKQIHQYTSLFSSAYNNCNSLSSAYNYFFSSCCWGNSYSSTHVHCICCWHSWFTLDKETAEKNEACRWEPYTCNLVQVLQQQCIHHISHFKTKSLSGTFQPIVPIVICYCTYSPSWKDCMIMFLQDRQKWVHCRYRSWTSEGGYL